MNAVDVLKRAEIEIAAGRPVAIAAVVATRGSTPQPAGVIVCVDQAAQLSGSLGGGCVEAEVRRQAHQLIAGGRGALLTFKLDNDFGYDDGMICGGEMDVAVGVFAPSGDADAVTQAVEGTRAGESVALPLRVHASDRQVEYRVRVEPQPRLLIAGAGHIGRVVAQMASTVGFDVHVMDDRSEYVNPGRFPPPIQHHVGDIAHCLVDCVIDRSTYIVIVTRGHKHDEACLKAVLDSQAKYIGMIGSRRKIGVTFDDLRAGGAREDQLQRVCAPIGLDINAVTAEEIAVSIVAQLISVRRKEQTTRVTGPKPIRTDPL